MIDRILGLMAKNEVTAAKLAVDTGLSHGAVTEWKKGKSKPGTDAVVKIAEYFGVTTDYILKGGAEVSDSNVEFDGRLQDINIGIVQKCLQWCLKEFVCWELPDKTVWRWSVHINDVLNHFEGSILRLRLLDFLCILNGNAEGAPYPTKSEIESMIHFSGRNAAVDRYLRTVKKLVESKPQAVKSSRAENIAALAEMQRLGERVEKIEQHLGFPPPEQ